MTNEYASRSYRYAPEATEVIAEAVAASVVPLVSAAGASLFRFFLGRDTAPVALDPAMLPNGPQDPFWRIVLAPGHRPATLEALLAALGGHLPDQRSYLVGDGSQIPWSPGTAEVPRALRLVVTRDANGAQPDLMVSTAPRLRDAAVFLQVIAWDETAGAYQFYDRRVGAWTWAGSSWEALAPDTRGKGPFDSHVNGALNMKELKAPWLHWHSMAALVSDDVLAPNDPFRAHPLWAQKAQAEDFETRVARPGIERWAASRVARSTREGRLVRFPGLFRQIVETTTVNIASSPQESALGTAGGPAIRLPLTFLVDRDALFDTLGLAPDIEAPIVEGALYTRTLADFDVHLTDGTNRFPGDTHFAFAVPERAYEDLVVLRALLDQGVLSPRLAACLLMVDFANPIFSSRRASLARYAPAEAVLGDPDGFELVFVDAIRRGGNLVAGSAEEEFLQNLALPAPEWPRAFEARIERLFAGLRPRWSDAAGFADLFRLAESRRREFRGRPLAEFALTFPRSSASDAPLRELTADGDVRLKT